MEQPYYQLAITEAVSSFNSHVEGLGEGEIRARREKHGANRLPEEPKRTALTVLWQQFNSALIYILLAAAIISFFLGDHLDMYVILAAVGLNVIVGFIQEYRAQKTLEKLRTIVAQFATVRRGGEELRVRAEDIVPGDILVLQTGDKVTADIRLVTASELSINESSLTGESKAIHKHTDAIESEVPLGDRKNMAFTGTTVVGGSGEGVVVATGEETELGKIAVLLRVTKREETPLQQKLNRVGRVLAITILGVAAVIFVIGLIGGHEIEVIFTTSVALAVAAIPEGLAVVVTVVLAIGMQRILRQRALVKKLVAAETLGSTTVICTDKTGTLTEGEMRVVRIITDKGDHQTGAGTESAREHMSQQSYFMALKIGVLCSDAYIENPEEGVTHRVVVGNPTEKALVLVGYQAGFDIEKTRKDNPRLAAIPFSSTTKYMATVHHDPEGNVNLYCKGAPEVIFRHVDRIDQNGKIVAMDATTRATLLRQYEALSSEGMRLLAIGYKPEVAPEIVEQQEAALAHCVFVGFAVIKDPLRQTAIATIRQCQEAGIRPIMLTGDHPLTARAIATELGLPHGEENIIDGQTLQSLNRRQLAERIANIAVYARVTPQDKLRIIDAWQQRGEVVAMTGDGVNDAPALKSADIGVALGSGTDVAKEAADIVLLDNNFQTIVRAVRQGRIIYDNIKKVIVYLLSDSFTEMVIVTAAIFLGWPLPLLAAQILWINLVTDGFPSVAMTFEAGESDIMKRKPIPLSQSIIDVPMRTIIAVVSVLTGVISLTMFYFFWKHSGDVAYARTIVFAASSIDSLIYVLAFRSLRQPFWKQSLWSNPYLIVGVLLGFIIQIPAIYLPFFQGIFQTVSLSPVDWLFVLSQGVAATLVIEGVKLYFRRRKPASQRPVAPLQTAVNLEK